MNEGYIKLYRKTLDNEWHDDPITMAVWFYCLMRANYKPAKWHGEIIQPGQFVTSLKNMSKDVGITVRQLRTAINHLKSTHQLTQQTTKSASLITIENWAVYQSAGEKATSQATSLASLDRQATDKRPTTIKEINNNKNNKESERDIRERGPSIKDAERYDPVQYHTEEESGDMLRQEHEQFASLKAQLALEAQKRINEREAIQ